MFTSSTGGSEWVLIDVGYEETTEEVLDLVRKMDFSLSTCKNADRHARRRRSHPGHRPRQGSH